MTDSRMTGALSGLPSRKRIEDAVRAESERWKESAGPDFAPETINSRRCPTFAKAVLERLGLGSRPEEGPVRIENCQIDGAQAVGRWGGHCWIYASHLDLHFDAETPQGTRDWQDLPFYQRRRDDRGFPIGLVGEEILSDPRRIGSPSTLRQIESLSDVCHDYAHWPDGSERGASDPDATHTPTIWVEGQLPLPALKDCLDAQCPEREDWREWLREQNKYRAQNGLKTYHELFMGGIEDRIIVDGQGPFIWDGRHRVAWSIDQGKGAVPAYLGVNPGPQPSVKAAGG